MMNRNVLQESAEKHLRPDTSKGRWHAYAAAVQAEAVRRRVRGDTPRACARGVCRHEAKSESHAAMLRPTDNSDDHRG